MEQEQQSKRDKLIYKIAKDLYVKAKEAIADENRDALLHPADWLNNKESIVSAWKEYLDTTEYPVNDPFSTYMSFMYKNFGEGQKK